jgi:hypothetical protein
LSFSCLWRVHCLVHFWYSFYLSRFRAPNDQGKERADESYTKNELIYKARQHKTRKQQDNKGRRDKARQQNTTNNEAQYKTTARQANRSVRRRKITNHQTTRPSMTKSWGHGTDVSRGEQYDTGKIAVGVESSNKINKI